MTATEVDTSIISRMSEDDRRSLIENPLEFFTREINTFDHFGINSSASQLIDLTIDEETRRREGATLDFRYCVDLILVPNRAEIERANTLSLHAHFDSRGDEQRREAESIRIKEAQRVLDICQYLEGKGIAPTLNQFCDIHKPDEVGILAKGNPHGGYVMYQLQTDGFYKLTHKWPKKDGKGYHVKTIQHPLLDRVWLGFGRIDRHFF